MNSSATFASLVGEFSGFVNGAVLPLLISLALVLFLIGVVRLFFSQNEENREKGRQFALWGIVALVLIFAVWGIVSVFVGVLSS